MKDLGDHMADMHEDGPEMVLEHFLIPFLSNPNASGLLPNNTSVNAETIIC